MPPFLSLYIKIKFVNVFHVSGTNSMYNITFISSAHSFHSPMISSTPYLKVTPRPRNSCWYAFVSFYECFLPILSATLHQAAAFALWSREERNSTAAMLWSCYFAVPIIIVLFLYSCIHIGQTSQPLTKIKLLMNPSGAIFCCWHFFFFPLHRKRSGLRQMKITVFNPQTSERAIKL